MNVTVAMADLLSYSEHERRKWRTWIEADPSRLKIPMQAAGRFPDVNALLDHVFLVERRHLARLEGGTPPETTGVAAGDTDALFEYAALVRADFRRYLEDIDQIEADTPMELNFGTRTYVVPRGKLITHIVLHEVRHFAQLALAARLAGHPPPGEHDYFFWPGPEART